MLAPNLRRVRTTLWKRSDDSPVIRYSIDLVWPLTCGSLKVMCSSSWLGGLGIL